MEALRKKLNSSRGASILLALLFLLVCMMVGASVLMAAVSNAGKLRGNREEQQKYLTLSSALTLLCDELEGVEYVGKYRYGRVQVQVEEVTGYTDAGDPIWTWVDDHVRHYYWQEPGELRKKGGASWDLNKTLPFCNDLDVIFADHFEVPDGEAVAIDKYVYTPLNKATIQPQSPHTVTVGPKSGIDAGTYGRLADEVTVKAELNAKGEITLTATFTADDSYIMEAVLKPSGKPENIIVLSGSPEKQPELSGVPKEQGTKVELEKSKGVQNETKPKTDPKSLTWTLDHIVKKEKEAEGG